ncbi:DUF4232 domain-containing protein [Streptomyces sp. TP-A0356]|uniref:DUF4232 domain-containing protein n=1 Tax=Streptomyces sp. TP-A0356 TaxID=1359208 RepID=UPI0006E3FA38|nr:DUF4232 domain-containing protein [Streptomyces sp. TP-A0356]
MNVQQFRKVSAAAALVLAAGLSLTACNGDGGSNDSGSSSAPSASAASGGGSANGGSGATAPSGGKSGGTAGGSGGSGTTSGGSGATGHSGASCKTANLTFAKGSSFTQSDYTHIAVKLTNSGPASCTLHGFPGVDLVGKDGRVSAQRNAHTPVTVTLAPGRSASFDLRVLQNNTGGSGVTFTSAVITPPNETHAHTLALTVNLPAQGDGAKAQPVVVGPVTR